MASSSMTESTGLTSLILPLTIAESPIRSAERSWTELAATIGPEPPSLNMQDQPPERLLGKACTVTCQPGSGGQRPRYSSLAFSKNRCEGVPLFRLAMTSAADVSRIVIRWRASAGVALSDVRSGVGLWSQQDDRPPSDGALAILDRFGDQVCLGRARERARQKAQRYGPPFFAVLSYLCSSCRPPNRRPP